MAVIQYSAKVNYYSFLSGNPNAWQLIFPSSTVIERGDTVEVIEVDTLGVPTGLTMTGTVEYVNCNNTFSYTDGNTLVHILPD